MHPRWLQCLALTLGWPIFAMFEGPLVQSSASVASVQSQEEKPRHTVTGTVTDGVSGAPVSHARVELSGPKDRSVYTGPDGRFQIDDVPEGRVSLTPSKGGFFDSYSLSYSMAAAQSRRPHSQPVLTVGPDKNDFPLVLFPASKITGQITEENGKPITNTVVQVLHLDFLHGHKRWLNNKTSTTNNEGSFRIDDLFPGSYLVFACGYPLEASDSKVPPHVIAPAYSGDTTDIASAKPIELHLGQEFHADVHLKEEPGYRVSAKVIGIPANLFVDLQLQNPFGQFVSEGISFDRQTGRLAVQALPKGIWTVVISGNEGYGRQFEARQQIDVSADISDLEILVHHATSIPIVVNHTASPIADTPEEQYRRLMMSAPELSLTSTKADDWPITLGDQGVPPVLMFNPVPPGEYRLHVGQSGRECVESASYKGVDVIREKLVIGPEDDAQPLTLDMSYACAALSAKLGASGNEDEGFLVVVPTALAFADAKTLSIGSQSSLAITLSPGTYQVFAFSTLDGLEYSSLDALKSFSGQNVDLKAGQKAELTLKLIERTGN